MTYEKAITLQLGQRVKVTIPSKHNKSHKGKVLRIISLRDDRFLQKVAIEGVSGIYVVSVYNGEVERLRGDNQ